MNTNKPMHTLFIVLKSGTWVWFSHTEGMVFAQALARFHEVRTAAKLGKPLDAERRQLVLTQSVVTETGVSERPQGVLDLDEADALFLTPGQYAAPATFGISPCPTIQIKQPEAQL